jgi:hypothetical protein
MIQDPANTELLVTSEPLRYWHQLTFQLFKYFCNGIACTRQYVFHLLDITLEEYGKADPVCIVSAFDGFDPEQGVNNGSHGFLFNAQESGDFRF